MFAGGCSSSTREYGTQLSLCRGGDAHRSPKKVEVFSKNSMIMTDCEEIR